MQTLAGTDRQARRGYVRQRHGVRLGQETRDRLLLNAAEYAAHPGFGKRIDTEQVQGLAAGAAIALHTGAAARSPSVRRSSTYTDSSSPVGLPITWWVARPSRVSLERLKARAAASLANRPRLPPPPRAPPRARSAGTATGDARNGAPPRAA